MANTAERAQLDRPCLLHNGMELKDPTGILLLNQLELTAAMQAE